VLSEAQRLFAQNGRRSRTSIPEHGILAEAMADPVNRAGFSTTTIVTDSERIPSHGAGAEVTAFVIAWSAAEPERIGEVAIIPELGTAQELGRGPGEDAEAHARIRFFRQRPASMVEGAPLASPGLSRRQLLILPMPTGARIDQIGKCALEVNGRRVESAAVRPGDVIVLKRELVLYCTRRPAFVPAPRLFPQQQWGTFGDADAVGILGESPHVWRMREAVAFAAKADTHVLLLGESGTGKELAARAIHHLSTRTKNAFVARNAATLPSGLIDAELFGNAKNYPNPGMPDRPGLIGEADGGTLFLDEIGELPVELQSHLLRVLDADGEYQRLGDATARRSRLRLIAATNRDASALKHDFAARFTARVEMPSLEKRREDIPLLARHLLLRAAKKSPDIAGHFIARTSCGHDYPRIHPSLVSHLLQRGYTANIRELDAMLWRAMSESHGDVIEPLSEMRTSINERAAAPSSSRPSESPAASADPPAESRPDPNPDEIRAALAQCDGRVAEAARTLGMKSRYALYRLMKKHNIDTDTPSGD
jgi:two-component system nitrogen regulation response regulator GlnG/two-component system response regulator HydG